MYSHLLLAGTWREREARGEDRVGEVPVIFSVNIRSCDHYARVDHASQEVLLNSSISMDIGAAEI